MHLKTTPNFAKSSHRRPKLPGAQANRIRCLQWAVKHQPGSIGETARLPGPCFSRPCARNCSLSCPSETRGNLEPFFATKNAIVQYKSLGCRYSNFNHFPTHTWNTVLGSRFRIRSAALLHFTLIATENGVKPRRFLAFSFRLPTLASFCKISKFRFITAKCTGVFPSLSWTTFWNILTTFAE